jgi:hypothetical protein
MPDYPNVKNAHIVPQTDLVNWAVAGKIGVWLVPEGRQLSDQPIRNVGTRRRFYQRERPDGSDINDTEGATGVRHPMLSSRIRVKTVSILLRRRAASQRRAEPGFARWERQAGQGSEMERTGIEPVTSGLQSRRSPS